MNSARAVVDASVIVDLLIDPGERARRIADRIALNVLHAPDHLGVEVVNTLRQLRNRGVVTESIARLAIQGFSGMRIQLWPFGPLSSRAWELGHNVTSYDAAYVALAELLDAPLLTGDRRLAGASGTTCAFEIMS